MGKIAKKKLSKEPSAPDKCPKAWEKARRDRMKVLFDELSRLLPKFDPATPPSRPEIIKKAMSYIRDLQAQNEDLLNGGFDEVYKKKIDTWKRRVKELLCRVEQLSGILKTANIHLPPLAVEAVPSWTTNRPKHWTEKVKMTEEKLGEVMKQLSNEKKRKSISKNKKQVSNQKTKVSPENFVATTSKENDPTVLKKYKEKTKNVSVVKKRVAPKIIEIQPAPVSVQSGNLIQSSLVAQQTQNIVTANTGSQPSTFLLTSQGNLLPVITPNAGVLTPVIINRPPPLLVIQAPQQPPPLPTLVSRPPLNKKRIERDSTVMTFSIKRPISALSKHSHSRRVGKCLGHKKLQTSNVLLPIATNTAPAVSPTAAFLNSFPVVATPKVFNSEDAPNENKSSVDENTNFSENNAGKNIELNDKAANEIQLKKIESKTEVSAAKESENNPSDLCSNEAIKRQDHITFNSKRVEVFENQEKGSLATLATAGGESPQVGHDNLDRSCTFTAQNNSENKTTTKTQKPLPGLVVDGLTNATEVIKTPSLEELPTYFNKESSTTTTTETGTSCVEANISDQLTNQSTQDASALLKSNAIVEQSNNISINSFCPSNVSKNINQVSLAIDQSKKDLNEDSSAMYSNKNNSSENQFSKWQVSVLPDLKSNEIVPNNKNKPNSSVVPVSNVSTESRPKIRLTSTAVETKNNSALPSFSNNTRSCIHQSYSSDTKLSLTSALLVPSTTTSSSELYQPQNAWLPPISSVYSNETLCKTTSATTWRPMAAEPSWTAPHVVAEPWKLDSTASATSVKCTGTADKAVDKNNSNSLAAVSSASNYSYFPTTREKIGPAWHTSLTATSTAFSDIQAATALSVASAPSQITSSQVLSNHEIPFPFTPNRKSAAETSATLLQQNQLWSAAAPTPKVFESNLKSTPDTTDVLGKSQHPTSVAHTFSGIDNTTSFPDGNYKSSGPHLKNNNLFSDSSVSFSSQPLQASSLNFPSSTVASSNYTLTELNTFNIKTYPAALPKKDSSFSHNYSATFANDVPSFPLEMSKALFNEPPYSLTVPKTTSDSYFCNVPTYHPGTSTHFTPHSTHISKVSNSKLSMPFTSSLPPSSAPENKSLNNLLPSKGSTDSKSTVYSDQKMRHDNPYTLPTSMNNQDSSKITNKASTQSGLDSGTHLWNSSGFSQSANVLSEVGGSWGHVDYSYLPESKDNRVKAPINWMTEPEQRSNLVCHGDDAFQPKYQKEVQVSHNVLDFCFNNSTEEEGIRGKNKRKDGDHSSQDYFGWASMKMDPLVVPSTLPTLVGDLALGGEPVPSKRCKTPALQEAYEPIRSEKHKGAGTNLTHEPFTNLSKNIFDTSQVEPNKSTNVPETIVLKNIFELPNTPSGKQRPTHSQNSFLSVSQLVNNQTHSNDAGQAKSDYTYYNQRSGKGKRGSGWKCGEKKCQQTGKACSSYSAEALLRSNDTISTDEDFQILGPSIFPLEFHQDHPFSEPAEPTTQSRQKPTSSRTRKSDAWKTEEYKPNIPTSISQPFLSPARPTMPKKLPDLSFSFTNLPSGALATPPAPNIPLSHTFSELSYARFPSNPSVYHGHHFPHTKPEATADSMLTSPNRSCAGDNMRQPVTNRKSNVYSRSHIKQSFPYSLEPNKLMKSTISLVGSQSVTSAYSKTNNQIAPLHTPAYPTKQPIIPQHPPIGASLAGASVYHTKSTTVSSPSNDSAMYCSKGTNNFQKMHSSPASGAVAYPSKMHEKVQQPPISMPLTLTASYMAKSSDAIQQTVNTSLAITAPYSTLPSLPPHLAVSSSNSLANFNLTTIFPEMNKKGYQYS